ncbi:MAG: SRPBCC family protein [Bryobacter sp.]|nr:SRPBCC family protein [Bryobacter sp.]
MPRFSYSSYIRATPERVFQFHERPDAFALLTPPASGVEILRRDAGLHVGAETLVRVPLVPLGKGLMRVDWLARHTRYEPPRMFADEQVYGPFAVWRHEHIMEAEMEGTRLRDEIEFVLPGGWLVNLFGGPFVKLQLQNMFAFRHMMTKKYCE